MPFQACSFQPWTTNWPGPYEPDTVVEELNGLSSEASQVKRQDNYQPMRMQCSWPGDLGAGRNQNKAPTSSRRSYVTNKAPTSSRRSYVTNEAPTSSRRRQFTDKALTSTIDRPRRMKLANKLDMGSNISDELECSAKDQGTNVKCDGRWTRE